MTQLGFRRTLACSAGRPRVLQPDHRRCCWPAGQARPPPVLRARRRCRLPPPPVALPTERSSAWVPLPACLPPADLSKAVAQGTGKPEAVSLRPAWHLHSLLTQCHTPTHPPRPSCCLQYVMVSLQTDKQMMFAGTEEQCAYGELVSIGASGGDKNKKVGEPQQLARSSSSRAIPPVCECPRIAQPAHSVVLTLVLGCANPTSALPTALCLPTAAPLVLSQISAALAEVVQRHLGVPPNRLYIRFCDVARTDFGWNGSTF